MEITMNPVNSTNIESVGYSAEKQVMRITFNSGKSYDYSGVVQETYDQLVNSGSPGQYFRSAIIGNYPYKQVG